ncbi:MAG: ATP-dependent helicase [Clostridia bacterium]|nr:ATP-dependent helicase [Clostridia bacterium]
MKFNTEQQKAVAHKDGALLVLAGPGSGKTAVITHRTQKLIQEYQVAPSSILVVTFTKAAARQMKERFLNLTGEKNTAVTFGTFHGIFYAILRQAYGITSKNIASEDEKYRILKELLHKTSMDVDDENDLIESLSREISMVKNERIPLSHYYSASCPDEEFRRIYENYERILHGRRLLDFDDLMVYCYKLFQKHPDILAAWQKKFRYILIDEFQDVNQIQYDIVRLLALPENNLFLVGDDDQSIYRFRGAKPEIMLHVPKDYPGMEQLILKQNYRCSGEIVEKSQNLIRWNDARFDKQLETENPKGKVIECRTFENESEETSWMIKSIQKDLEEGCPCREIAVLFRTNVGSRMSVERMMEYNLPFTMRDVLPNLYEHWLARNMVSYMKLAMGGRGRSDFLAIMNRPNRYLSREAFYEKEMPFEILYQFYEGKEWMCDRIEKFEHDIKIMKNMNPYAAINYIRYGIGYDEYLKEYADYRRIKVDELYDILREIQESAKGYQTYQEWFDYMEEYKEKLKEHADRIRLQTEAVTISTLHSAKGLEFERVYILDVNEGSIPYHKAVLDVEIEEERRMFYVGMTRAKKELHLYSVEERFGKQLKTSRFLDEIEEAPKKQKV